MACQSSGAARNGSAKARQRRNVWCDAERKGKNMGRHFQPFGKSEEQNIPRHRRRNGRTVGQFMIQKYIIYGKPITKKNSPRIGYVGAHCPVCHKGKYAKVLPSAAYLKYARTAKIFLKPAPKNPLDGRYNVKCLYYMPTRHRVDKTNLESAIMDILVDARILKDDNSNIVAATDGSRVLYDKANPRTEIFIEEIEEQEEPQK